MKQLPNAICNTENFILKCWGYTLASALLFFAPFIFNFLWGNHDWQWVQEYTPLWSGVFEGRFTQFILQTVLFNGVILPVATLSVSLAFFAAAAILLLYLWQIPPKKWIYITLYLSLITAPYTLSWLYFAFITLSCLSWPFFIILGFRLLERSKNKHPAVAFCIAVILFLAALGGYPPVINLIGVIFFTLILSSLSFQKETAKTIIIKYLPHIAAISLSATLLLFIQYELKKHNLQFGTYNTAGPDLTHLGEKINLTARAAIEQFFISLSFIGPVYKLIYCFLFLSALVELYIRLPKNRSSVSLFILSIAGLILSPLITLFLAGNTQFVLNEPRIAFFGLTYIFLFSAAVLLRSSSTLRRNITTLLLIIILLHNFNTIAYAAKVWGNGFRAEAAFSERFLARLEENPDFSIKQKYTFIQGGNLDFRSRYYLPDGTKPDAYTLTAPYIPWHLPSKAYRFYYPVNFVGNDFDTFWRFIDPSHINRTNTLEKYVLYQAEPWPHPNAVYLDDTTIILTQSPEGKYAARSWIEYIRQNYPH